ncbi:MAG: Cu(I)-responsive transcriptional regulator [Kiloniellales bacterium]|nr:Cu(I)-responsive transcriptional regulator [Kiloniellales bacterium]
MNIGTAARASGVPAKTIRYYEEIGLIRPAERSGGNYRVYGDLEVETLRFIRRARGLGFSVDEVTELLDLWRDRGRSSRQVKALANRHLADIDGKIAALKTMRDTLNELIERCHGDDRPDCPILADLAGQGGVAEMDGKKSD